MSRMKAQREKDGEVTDVVSKINKACTPAEGWCYFSSVPQVSLSTLFLITKRTHENNKLH